MDTTALTAFVADALAALANPTKARAMAAYMKTNMPFYGVQKGDQKPVFDGMVRRFPPASSDDYRQAVQDLWRQPRREEKYAALHYAAHFKRFVAMAQLPLYEQLIREGAWWDLVDSVIGTVINRLALREPQAMQAVTDRWIDDDDFWLRRAAILSQLKSKHATDAPLLFRYCLACAHEREFFVRKAIGWALRHYARYEPHTVRDFLLEHGSALSPLSYREASKHLKTAGLLG